MMRWQTCHKFVHGKIRTEFPLAISYPVLVDANRTNFDRKFVFDYLRKSHIGVNVHYIPVHTQPFYRRRGFKIEDFPLSEWYYSRTISLPLYYGLSDDDQQIEIDTLRDAFESG